MDEMKLQLQTKFMRDMVAKILNKIVYKKVGIKPNIQIDSLGVELKDGKINFNVSMNGSVDELVFLKVNQFIDEY